MLEIEHPVDAPGAQQRRTTLHAMSKPVLFVGGGTALQLAWGQTVPSLTLVDVSRLPQAQGIELTANTLRIGAAVRLETLRRDPLAALHAPLLAAACEALAALSVRHLATLGGNVGWGFGDTLAPLLALQAHAELADGTTQPLVTLLRQTELPLVIALHVGLGRAAPIAFYEKIGHRAAFSPSRLALALCADIDQQGSLQQVSAAASGAGLRGRRLDHVEQALHGVPFRQVTPAQLRDACLLDLPEDGALARLASRVLAGHLATWMPSRPSVP